MSRWLVLDMARGGGLGIVLYKDGLWWFSELVVVVAHMKLSGHYSMRVNLAWCSRLRGCVRCT